MKCLTVKVTEEGVYLLYCFNADVITYCFSAGVNKKIQCRELRVPYRLFQQSLLVTNSLITKIVKIDVGIYGIDIRPLDARY